MGRRVLARVNNGRAINAIAAAGQKSIPVWYPLVTQRVPCLYPKVPPRGFEPLLPD